LTSPISAISNLENKVHTYLISQPHSKEEKEAKDLLRTDLMTLAKSTVNQTDISSGIISVNSKKAQRSFIILKKSVSSILSLSHLEQLFALSLLKIMAKGLNRANIRIY
jgi:hypothetical protein